MDLSNMHIIHVKEERIEYLQFKKLLDENLVNCYTTKAHNFDLASKIGKEKLEENYHTLCNSLKIKRESIVRPIQTHTDVIKRVDNLDKNYQDVDGLITNKPGINLMLTFADCTPIFIYDQVHHAIGNIHSGWKGTVQKIGQKAVLRMKEEYDSKQEDLIVCIGPCIKSCHFEVRDDVKKIFEETFGYLGKNDDIIKNKEGEKDKYLIDTTLINELILEEVGVKLENIIDSEICTVCNSSILHSYRAERDASGRNVAVLGMK